MKKLLCFLLCLTLIFSSISLCFATPTQWDTSDQANLRYIYQTLTSGSMYTLVNNIYSRMNTINNSIQDLADFLVYNGDTITEWIYNIDTWMSPIYNTLVSLPTDLTSITSGLWKNIGNDTYIAYNELLYQSLGSPRSAGVAFDSLKNAHSQLPYSSSDWYSYRTILGDGSLGTASVRWINGTPLGNIVYGLVTLNSNLVNYANIVGNDFIASRTSQTYTDWTDLSSSTFTPSKSISGIYNWLSLIQTPVARLSYVLASDERIEAQEAAAANEEAVVDNFIDSTGDGAASPSDIGSVSGLSSEFKQSFASDASPSGIFDIFNADHATWFSQETKNQLDTTTTTRLTKDSQSETPLLDKQIEDIYNALGVKQP